MTGIPKPSRKKAKRSWFREGNGGYNKRTRLFPLFFFSLFLKNLQSFYACLSLPFFSVFSFASPVSPLLPPNSEPLFIFPPFQKEFLILGLFALYFFFIISSFQNFKFHQTLHFQFFHVINFLSVFSPFSLTGDSFIDIGKFLKSLSFSCFVFIYFSHFRAEFHAPLKTPVSETGVVLTGSFSSFDLRIGFKEDDTMPVSLRCSRLSS